MRFRRLIRQVKRAFQFRPWVVKNNNTNEKQLLLRGKIRGKEFVIKKQNKAPEWRIIEKINRQSLLKSLPRLQGKKYTLRASKRYYSGGKIFEHYYDLPTRSEVLDVYIDRVSPKVEKICQQANISPHEFYENCEEAFKELYNRMRRDPAVCSVDIYAGNVLVDVGTNGKIIFTLIDF